ncbi:MAG: aldehyde dehydrogenase [Sphingomonadaceae bacterium]|nr:aldehyde dehydrogenase [Altererythrobacter sp.]MCP5392912.1 aldehyde dehydrogenase [Sphingomonadaceae bacterium]
MNWKNAAAKLDLRSLAFIDGKTVQADDGSLFDTINPATGNLLTSVAACGQRDADLAVAAARRVFEKGSWSRLAPAERGRRLIRFADLMEKHGDELALLETLDVGKPISDSLSVDVPLTVGCARWYGEAVDKIYDEIAPTKPGAIAMMRREPLGVVAAVVPWNFPLLMAMWKIAPVLAAGNSLILKPAEQSPLSALRIAELAVEAGIPDGVFNVLPGLGPVAGRALGLHHDVDAITFTGSTKVGRYFMEYSGKSNLKRVSLECGGKSPNIILADAPDLDAAATAAAWGIFYNQGEVCNAGSRLVVEESVKDEVLEKVIAVARTIKVGDPLDAETQMGPIVDEGQMSRVIDYIAKGTDEGAKLVTGGKALPGTKGYFVEPTIFDDVTNDMTIAQEEIFGPVLATISARDLGEAVKIGNDSVYGLAAAVWTADIDKAFAAARDLRAGVVWVNCFDHGDISSPFGGFKQSGFGRDKSLHALDKYVDIKTTWINLAR